MNDSTVGKNRNDVDCGFNAGDAAHHDVCDEDVGLQLIRRFYSFFSAVNGFGFEPARVQDACQRVRDGPFVIRDEHSDGSSVGWHF